MLGQKISKTDYRLVPFHAIYVQALLSALLLGILQGILASNINLTLPRFTWRQKTPVVQRRLDYWLISDSLQDEIISAEIKTSIKTDHSAITLSISGLDDTEIGPNFWKFNSNLVNDSH